MMYDRANKYNRSVREAFFRALLFYAKNQTESKAIRPI